MLHLKPFVEIETLADPSIRRFQGPPMQGRRFDKDCEIYSYPTWSLRTL